MRILSVCQYCFECLAGRVDGGGNFFFPVRRAQKRSLELRRRQPDALFQHGPVEAAEGGGIGFGGFVVVRDRPGGEEPCPHGAYAVEGQRNTSLDSLGGNAFGYRFGGG